MSPFDFGAPAKYTEWRLNQDDIFAQMLASSKKFLVLNAPTGIGKSLLNMTYGTATKARAAYLTSTKALQDQLMRDFASIGLADARGMNNYECIKMKPRRQMCDQGPCLDGGQCEYLRRGCLYFDALNAAKQSQLAVSNYHLALTSDDVLGARSLLICDEAHDLPELLTGNLRVEFSQEGMRTMPMKAEPTDMAPWKEWAAAELPSLKEELAGLPTGTPEHRKIKNLVRDLTRVLNISGTWAWEPTRHGAGLEPLWPKHLSGALFDRSPKIILSSATIVPATLARLGLAPDDYDLVSALSPFPVKNRPIYFFKECGRIGYDMDPFTFRKWLDIQDEIMAGRMDRKGIIHTVSYKRAQELYHASRFREFMFLPTARTARETMARFRAARPPAILVSPSAHTGYDFPYDAARYQIIAKLPFPSPNPILDARQAEDKDYGKALAAATLVQMAGRPVRADDDWAETFIVDGHFSWLHSSRYRRLFFPASFNEAVRHVTKVPSAPKLR